jgi:predicted DNA-binding transcriptional regulator AlpA
MQSTKRLLNISETAQYLGIAPKTLRNRLGPKAENPFPVQPKRIGKRVLFDVKKLDEFIDSPDMQRAGYVSCLITIR